MKHINEVTVPAKTRKQCTHISCDLCGKRQEVGSYYGGVIDWADPEGDSYRINKTSTIMLKTGSSYPEGSSGEEINYQICPECFQLKLIPFMESNGAKTIEESWG